MKALVLSTKSEFEKLLLKKKYIVFTLIGALICMLRLGGNILISKVSGGEIVIKSNLVMSMLGFSTDILVPLIVFMAAADLFQSEIQEDTMKAALMRPLTRFKVMTSKALAVFLLGAAVMIVMFVICLVFQITSGGGLGAAGQTLAAYLIDIIPIASIVSLALLINMLSKNPALSMLLCIVVYIFFKYLNLYVSPIGQMVFTAYSQWHKIWIGSTLPIGTLIGKTSILFSSVLILYTLSYIIFDKRDI